VSSPSRPRLPSVWDGPLGPPREIREGAPRLRGAPARKASREDAGPSPALPPNTGAPPAQAVLAALEAELIPDAAAPPAAPATAPPAIPDALPAPAREALGVAYEAVLRELSEPEPAMDFAAVPPTPVQIDIPPDVSAWFAAKGLDLAGMTETLLRSYMREIDEQQRRRTG
jgi:hypothetical protein